MMLRWCLMNRHLQSSMQMYVIIYYHLNGSHDPLVDRQTDGQTDRQGDTVEGIK